MSVFVFCVCVRSVDLAHWSLIGTERQRRVEGGLGDCIFVFGSDQTLNRAVVFCQSGSDMYLRV